MPQWSVAPAVAGSSTGPGTQAGQNKDQEQKQKRRGRPRTSSSAPGDEPPPKRRFATRAGRPSVGRAWLDVGRTTPQTPKVPVPLDAVGWRDAESEPNEGGGRGRNLPGTAGNDGLWAERRAHARARVLGATAALAPRGEIPHDDLLISLHLHAARFFAAHGALRCPRPWKQKGDEGDEGYAAALAAYRADLGRAAYRRNRRSEMHTALEGSALLALGVLAEEIVAHELGLAGYTKDTDGKDQAGLKDAEDQDGQDGRKALGDHGNEKTQSDAPGDGDDDDDDPL